MLIIRCAYCKAKLLKYEKVGPGRVIRCHKARIVKFFKARTTADSLMCPCGKTIGIDMGRFFKMNADAFTSSGVKQHSLTKR